MHASLSFSFSLSLLAAVGVALADASADGAEPLVRSPADLDEDTVFSALINRTNLTLLPFFPYHGQTRKNDSEGHPEAPERQLLLDGDGRRGTSCLMNLTGCMKKDYEYHSSLEHLTQYMFSSLPPFDLSSVPGVSKKCRKRSSQYMRELKRFKLWALKMYDASAKLPSGLLNGNVNQLGDFDQCLAVASDRQTILGQYCLASMQVETPRSPYLSALHELMHAHYAFRSKLEDPGHRVPRFSSINWALCVPHDCSAKDIELGLRRTLNVLFNSTELEVRLEVDPAMCQHARSKPIPLSTILASAFFVSIILTALVATLYDFTGGKSNQLLLAFSLIKILYAMLSMKRSADDIKAVHSVRLLNALMLILAHKSMAIFFVPYTNRTAMSELLGQPWTVLGRAASLYTDPFIMMSGTLTAYSLFGKLQKEKKINIFYEYLSRFFRIVPTLAALILFCTFVLPWVNSGPQWNLVVTHHSDVCKKYWWRNMLFIHNYFGFKDMCLTHTHHVGIDTQLFLTSTLVIPLVWKRPRVGFPFLVIVALISTIMRYYVTYTKKLSNYIHYGTSIQQLFDTADNMYILPAHRATVYIMGIFLAYLLHHSKGMRLSTSQVAVGNAVAILCFCCSFFGPAFMGSSSYIYDPVHAAWYAAFAPILWCISFGWVIFIVQIDCLGYIGKLISWEGFLITTRLSYGVYLTQFPIFFYNIGVTRTQEHYEFFTTTFDFWEIGWIFATAIILTVLFDMPCQRIRNILLQKKIRNERREETEQKTK